MDRSLDPGLYSYLGTTLLPQMQAVVESSGENVQLFGQLSNDDLRMVVEGCLSASHFGKQEWKHRIIAYAQSIMETSAGSVRVASEKVLNMVVSLTKSASRRAPDRTRTRTLPALMETYFPSDQLSVRLGLRRRELSRLFSPSICSEQVDYHVLDATMYGLASKTARSNAYFGGLVLLKAQERIDCHDIPGAWYELLQFKPLNGQNPSFQEMGMSVLVEFYKGKVCRYKGDFPSALQNFTQLMRPGPSNGDLSQVATHLVAVYCELGNMDQARWALDIEARQATTRDFIFAGKQKRLELATASMYLMEALHMVMSDLCSYKGSYGRRSLQRQMHPDQTLATLMLAKKAYEQLAESYKKLLNPGKLARMSKFTVQAGLAITHRLLGDLNLSQRYWELAAQAAEECGWGPGFAEMIITYSMGEIMLSKCMAESVGLVKQAKNLFDQCGRQFYFTGLGTIWFDWVSMSLVTNGGERIDN